MVAELLLATIVDLLTVVIHAFGLFGLARMRHA